MNNAYMYLDAKNLIFDGGQLVYIRFRLEYCVLIDFKTSIHPSADYKMKSSR